MGTYPGDGGVGQELRLQPGKIVAPLFRYEVSGAADRRVVVPTRPVDGIKRMS